MADVVPLLRGHTELTTIIRGAGLVGLVRPASQPVDTPVTTNELLPVIPALRALLPAGGLRRGSTVAVGGLPGVIDGGAATDGEQLAGATSALLTLLSAASAGGSWCAVVGLPALGAVAAAELGVCLERLALVPHPGLEWPAVVAALLDGFDVVVAAPPGPVAATVASRLSARARQRGSVLVAAGAWSGADLVLTPTGSSWSGLGPGRGRLVRHELVVTARGRGAATRPRRAHLVLATGTAQAAVPATAAPGVTTISPAAEVATIGQAIGVTAVGPAGAAPGVSAIGLAAGVGGAEPSESAPAAGPLLAEAVGA